MALEVGAEKLKNTALLFHPQEASTNNAGLVLLQ